MSGLTGPQLLALALGTSLALGLGATALAVTGRLPWGSGRADAGVQGSTEDRELRQEHLRREHLQELGRRVDPLPSQRRFDRSAMRTGAAPETEVITLRQMLVEAERELRAEQWSTSKEVGDEIAGRVALFPWAFGRDPRSCRSWPSLAAEARRVLADVEGTAPTLVLSAESSSAQLFRVLLLDLAGRSDEARTLLADITVQHWCGTCGIAEMSPVHRRRSEVAELQGDAARALALLEQSLLLYGAAIDIADHIGCTRFGLLLLQSGRIADGLAVLQLVVDLRPDTAGADVARAALEQVGALREPTLERLQAVYVDGYRQFDPYERWAVGVIADRGARGDERARPMLEGVLRDGEPRFVGRALQALHQLPGGAAPLVPALLARLADNASGLAQGDREAFDSLLRTICDGGPELPELDRMSDDAFAQAWQAWLEQHGHLSLR